MMSDDDGFVAELSRVALSIRALFQAAGSIAQEESDKLHKVNLYPAGAIHFFQETLSHNCTMNDGSVPIAPITRLLVSDQSTNNLFTLNKDPLQRSQIVFHVASFIEVSALTFIDREGLGGRWSGEGGGRKGEDDG